MTAEQLEAARSERMRHNGHAATQYEDVRTWIEETGLCLFLPRSVQAGFTAPTFVEAIAGRQIPEPNLDLIASAERLLVRLEAENVAVRLSLNGQPGDQPDYVVASWVLPYVYALRGDRDWRRPPQLTGSRQVSQLAVQVAKQLESGNQSAPQLRDALGREVSESATLRALHELWRQLRVIPVVPEAGKPALWQPLRQRFQKAIAEGASTSQVTAISVLASIYLQAAIAASMEEIELFLSPLTSRSKIREVVRGLAATRQVHTTTIGQLPLYYVAGTLPEFPAEPSFTLSGSTYLSRYQRLTEEREMASEDSVSLAAFAERQRDNQTGAGETPMASSAARRPSQPRRAVRPPARPHASSATGDRSRFHSGAETRNRKPATSRSAARPAVDTFRSRPATTANGAAPRPGKKVVRHARPAPASGRFQGAEKPSGFTRKPGERGPARPAAASTRTERNFRSDSSATGRKQARPATAVKPAARFAKSRPAAKSSERTQDRTQDRPTARRSEDVRTPETRTANPRSSVQRASDRRPGDRRPADRRAGSHPRPTAESSGRTSASKRYSLVGASARQSSQPKVGKPAARNRAR